MSKLRIDYLHDHPEYKVVQHKDMYHFNTDTCLLGEFIKINSGEKVLDIGTNNGALLVYIINKGGIATGIEINSDAIEICNLTLKENNLSATIINEDVTLWQSNQKYDVIVSNPPYFDSKDDAHKSQNEHKKLARHEGTLNLKSLCESIARLLKDTGKAYLVYRPSRLTELEQRLNEVNLYIKEFQLVYDTRKKEAKSVLVEITFEKGEKNQLEDKFI